MTEQQYQNFQTKLKTNKAYKYFWQFWAIYSFLFFPIVFTYGFYHALVLKDASAGDWRDAFVLSVVAFVLARVVVVVIINLFYKRQRPYQKFNLKPITSLFFSFKTKTPNSFPSRHTSAYMAVAVVVLMFFPWVGLGLVLVAILAGAGRVILGYHWPSDIIVGAILGTLLACLTVIYIPVSLFT